MKRKFTRRDVAFFFLGVFTFILIDAALNWDQSVESFKKGWDSYPSRYINSK